MPAFISEALLRWSEYGALWAVIVIAAMAITAVALYFFWDLVGRGISLVGRVLNVGRARQRG